ncbi:MAG: diguanylate cyclase [Deltaproteobacteria bacterium]|nr:diguanylate cyclase [Deltaproteobacteria bacterium]
MADRKPLILVVDDNPVNIHVLAQALQAEYTVKIATDGLKAVELAHHPEKPDLILLDVMMPEMDGYEVCQRLKESKATKNIPIIFVTAKNEVGDEEHGFNLGAADYITKPFAIPIVRARVGNHIKLKLKTDLLESLASLDGLTGIYNRRRFDEALDKEWRRAARNQAPLSLIMADVDYFKLYNDLYGHGLGDECLQNMAALLTRTATRPGDLAARYGGEEFVILLPETSPSGASKLAERFRASVEALKRPHKDSSTSDYVTVSVGCATMIPLPGSDPAGLLQAADRLLYQAKHEGRNRVKYE